MESRKPMPKKMFVSPLGQKWAIYSSTGNQWVNKNNCMCKLRRQRGDAKQTSGVTDQDPIQWKPLALQYFSTEPEWPNVPREGVGVWGEAAL